MSQGQKRNTKTWENGEGSIGHQRAVCPWISDKKMLCID